MRSLLTGGIKAILAVAVLSIAAHWGWRAKPVAAPAGMAAIPDPVTTGSIVPRKVERIAAVEPAAQPAAHGLDQQHLGKLIADTAPDRKPRALAKR